jgi:hypothetical protein
MEIKAHPAKKCRRKVVARTPRVNPYPVDIFQYLQVVAQLMTVP